jgi:hypothetical protein
MSRLPALLLLALLLLPPAAGALDTRDPLGEVIVENPDNPAGYKMLRPRRAGEPWCEWFCRVFLWPRTAERYNRLFTTFNQNGRRVQFLPDVIFAAEGRWYLVLRGEEGICREMGRTVFLEPVGGGPAIRPSGEVERCAACPPDIFIVPFAPPALAYERVMSAFPLFGDAGGVAQVLDEAQVRQKHPVLRDWVEDWLRNTGHPVR